MSSQRIGHKGCICSRIDQHLIQPQALRQGHHPVIPAMKQANRRIVRACIMNGAAPARQFDVMPIRVGGIVPLHHLFQRLQGTPFSGVSHNQRRNKAIAVVANIFNLRTGKISVRAVQCGNRIPQRLFQIGRRIEQAGSLYAAGLFQISSHFPFQPRVIRAECAHCCQMRPRRNNKRCRGPFFATPGTGKHPVSDHTAGHRPV